MLLKNVCLVDYVCLAAGTLILMLETASDPTQKTGQSSIESKASPCENILKIHIIILK